MASRSRSEPVTRESLDAFADHLIRVAAEAEADQAERDGLDHAQISLATLPAWRS